MVTALAPVSGRAAEVLTLEEARALALETRAELRASSARIRAAEAQVDVSGAGQAPRLGGRVEVSAAPGGRLVRITREDGTELLVSGSPPIGRFGAHPGRSLRGVPGA